MIRSRPFSHSYFCRFALALKKKKHCLDYFSISQHLDKTISSQMPHQLSSVIISASAALSVCSATSVSKFTYNKFHVTASSVDSLKKLVHPFMVLYIFQHLKVGLSSWFDFLSPDWMSWVCFFSAYGTHVPVGGMRLCVALHNDLKMSEVAAKFQERLPTLKMNCKGQNALNWSMPFPRYFILKQIAFVLSCSCMTHA